MINGLIKNSSSSEQSENSANIGLSMKWAEHGDKVTVFRPEKKLIKRVEVLLVHVSSFFLS